MSNEVQGSRSFERTPQVERLPLVLKTLIANAVADRRMQGSAPSAQPKVHIRRVGVIFSSSITASELALHTLFISHVSIYKALGAATRRLAPIDHCIIDSNTVCCYDEDWAPITSHAWAATHHEQ